LRRCTAASGPIRAAVLGRLPPGNVMGRLGPATSHGATKAIPASYSPPTKHRRTTHHAPVELYGSRMLVLTAADADVVGPFPQHQHGRTLPAQFRTRPGLFRTWSRDDRRRLL